ncbi:Crp/Fnr family transcriptional regulator [Pseudobdellovibrio exovorus]|uniref:Transcriptional regulator n=1 Tax=Pseudobdellovibrio exovorus JSS TaxID=1184267 RepID=M4VBN7_9BACT|nr:Crp/Fnr family transcriptional regulator [Pseudobdellovibrio exovorus]AGH95436.1 hypothetical protein A11Q_1220 [Pseudobdellovibrio exovorus JSS]
MKPKPNSGPQMHADCTVCDTKSKGFMCSTSDAVAKKVAEVKADCSYRAGEAIFRAGERSLGLFAVRKGVVKLESLSADGHSHTVDLVGPGGLLGYRALFGEGLYKKSAWALEDTEVCFLPKQEILDLFRCHPELGLKMIGQLGDDLDRAQGKWVNQIDKGAPARVADALLFLNEKFSGTSWTRKEIAEWAGTTTETVIRTLAQFEKEGIISQNYKNFTILSFQRLLEKSQSV